MIYGNVKFTKYFLFYGTCSKQWIQFAASMYAIKLSVLVYDASVTKEVFLSQLRDCEKSTVRFREKMWTTDLEYIMGKGAEYDLVLIYDDFSSPGNYAEYERMLDYGWFCCDASQFSIKGLVSFMDRYALDAHYPFSFVFDGEEREAREWDVLEYWKYLTTRRKAADKYLYIPRDEQDRRSYLNLEYGRFCFAELSPGLKKLLKNVGGRLGEQYQIEPLKPILGI